MERLIWTGGCALGGSYFTPRLDEEDDGGPPRAVQPFSAVPYGNRHSGFLATGR